MEELYSETLEHKERIEGKGWIVLLSYNIWRSGAEERSGGVILRDVRV